MEESPPRSEGRSSELCGVPEVNRPSRWREHVSFDVHSVHRADSKRFCLGLLKVWEWPFIAQVGAGETNECIITNRQTGVCVVITSEDEVIFRIVIPDDFFVAAR